MNVNMFVVGVGIFILSLFLAQAIPDFLPTVNAEAIDLLKIFFLFMGTSAIFIGAKT